MSVLSTGIGIGNIDNLGHGAGCVGECRFRHAYGQGEFRRLTLVRLGTSGNTAARYRAGRRGLLAYVGRLRRFSNYYKGRNDVCDLEIERAFMAHTG